MLGTDHLQHMNGGYNSRDLVMERRWNIKSTHTETAPNCPRCASTNTKFCYYNNYSLSQPRYFCKGCRRYWTKGGSLRNVPVGGGCRKSRKSKSARLAADQRQGLSYQMPSPGSTGANTDHDSTAANIDLAAVFASYVNQDSSSHNNNINCIAADVNVNVDQESSSSTTTTSTGVSCLEFPPTNCFDLGNMLAYDDHHMFNPMGLMDQDCDALNLQAILDGEDQEMLPDFDQWQSIMQFPDFSGEAGDFKNNNNIESWSSASYDDLSSSDYNHIFPGHDQDGHRWNNYD